MKRNPHSHTKVIGCLVAIIIIPLIQSCIPEYNYTVETFQQLKTSWEDQLYSEFEREASFYRHINFKFNIAKSPEETSKQITDAINRKVSAIVVNPFEEDTIIPAIEKAYDAGIKVVLVGQKLNSNKYTSYIGTDNKALGRTAASYICDRLNDKGNIVVIESVRNAPFYKDRYESFIHELTHHENVNIVGSFDAQWNADLAHKGMDSLAVVLKGTQVDAVFAFCDDAIIGAVESEVFPNALHIGIDGLIEQGLKAVQDGRVDATISNETNGGEAIRTVASILNGSFSQKDVLVPPLVIDTSNADEFAKAFKELEITVHRVDSVLNELEWSKSIQRKQARWMTYLILAAILLIGILMHTTIICTQNRRKSERFEEQLAEAQIKLETAANDKEVTDEINKTLNSELHALQDIILSTQSQTAEKTKESDTIIESVFMKKFRDAVNERLDDPDLSISTIAEEIGISRAQLFRKIKANTEKTPNDLIQDMRLHRGYELLRDTDMTVSEVAYNVGFTSPSYFSKCYKDKFGRAPKDEKTSQKPA